MAKEQMRAIRDEEDDIPDTTKAKPVECEVVAVGPDARNRWSRRYGR
jgi:hypothetical protein